MVPVTATANPAVSSALRKQVAETCGRDLSKAFAAWLLTDFNEGADLLAIAARAAEREGAGQDFQSVAILGFAADAGVLSDPELAALKKGLTRVAGRSPVVNGVPMPFCADAVGILGIALGTAMIADAEVTGQVVAWAKRFLKSAYERDRAEDWQRCLFAAADRQLGKPLDLAMPNSVGTADVRIALLARGLIEAGDGIQARKDATRALDLAVQEPLDEFDCDRAALRLAALEWVTRAAVKVADEKEGFISRSEFEVCAKAPRIVRPPVTTRHDNGFGIGITNRRPVNVSDRLRGFHQLASIAGIAVSHSVGAGQSQPAESVQRSPVQEAQQPDDSRKVKKPVRRNQKYKVIDKALREIAESRPRTQQEIFQSLEGRRVAIPPAEPFMTGRGWVAGFHRDAVAARAWLSKRWAELDLAPLPRGPKDRKK